MMIMMILRYDLDDFLATPRHSETPTFCDGVIVFQWIQMCGLEPMSEGSEPQVLCLIKRILAIQSVLKMKYYI